MKTNFQKTGLKLLATINVMFISEVAIARESCIGFPRNSANPVVEACESESEYVFRLGDTKYAYEIGAFQQQVHHAAMSWLSNQNLDILIDESSPVEIWLSVPESNPLAAQARAIFKTDHGKISFSFDVKSSGWTFSNETTSILGDQNYPNSFGHRPSKILASGTSGTPDSVVIDALLEAGAVMVRSEGDHRYSAICLVFDEASVVQHAVKLHSNVLKYVQVNSVYEWIADRQMAFSFPIHHN